MKRADFKEVEPHHFVFSHKAYRFAVRRNDGGLDISIKAEITQNPSLDDWDKALRVFNDFVQKEITAKERELG